MEDKKADSSLTTPELRNIRAPFAQKDTFNFLVGFRDEMLEFELHFMNDECVID